MTLEEIRARLIVELGALVEPHPPDTVADAVDGLSLLGLDATNTADQVAALAAALESVTNALMAAETRPAAPVAPFDVQGLLTTAWTATQEAGAPTSVGDAVIAAIRQFIEKGPQP